MQLCLFIGLHSLLELVCSVKNRLTQRFHRHHNVRPILSRKFRKLLESHRQFERLLTDVIQLVPHAVNLCHLFGIEHQAFQPLIFTIEKSQRDHHIHRYDFRVAKSDRKILSKMIKSQAELAVPFRGYWNHHGKCRFQFRSCVLIHKHLKLHGSCFLVHSARSRRDFCRHHQFCLGRMFTR